MTFDLSGAILLSCDCLSTGIAGKADELWDYVKESGILV